MLRHVLTTTEELEALPTYTPIQGQSSVPIVAHCSPNGLWWSTAKSPLLTQELLDLCPSGFEVLHSNEQSGGDDINIVDALNAVEWLDFFTRYDMTASEDHQHVRESANLLREFILSQ